MPPPSRSVRIAPYNRTRSQGANNTHAQVLGPPALHVRLSHRLVPQRRGNATQNTAPLPTRTLRKDPTHPTSMYDSQHAARRADRPREVSARGHADTEIHGCWHNKSAQTPASTHRSTHGYAICKNNENACNRACSRGGSTRRKPLERAPWFGVERARRAQRSLRSGRSGFGRRLWARTEAWARASPSSGPLTFSRQSSKSAKSRQTAWDACNMNAAHCCVQLLAGPPGTPALRRTSKAVLRAFQGLPKPTTKSGDGGSGDSACSDFKVGRPVFNSSARLPRSATNTSVSPSPALPHLVLHVLLVGLDRLRPSLH